MKYEELLLMISNFENDKFKETIMTTTPRLLISSSGDTLVHITCEYDNIDLLKYLIENNCDENFINKNGQTPLDIAIKCNSEKCIEFLVEENADMDLLSKNSANLLDFGNDMSKLAIIKWNIFKFILTQSLIVSYKYRLYRYWHEIIHQSLKPLYKYLYINFTENYDKQLIPKLNINLLLKISDSYYSDFIKSFEDFLNENLNPKKCLYCRKCKNVYLKRCSQCKQVWFCNKYCQKMAHNIHRLDCHNSKSDQ